LLGAAMNYSREIDTPLFLVAGPELVMALSEHGVFGSFTLNARPQPLVDSFKVELAEHDRKTPALPSTPDGGSTATSKGN
jgi:hypothetical protein